MNVRQEQQVALVPRTEAAVRRFELADFALHGRWLLPRLRRTYQHLDDRAAASWLRGILYNNEWLFLCQPHGVSLSQVLRSEALNPKPLVRERFTWVESPEIVEQVRDAQWFYAEMHRWARSLGADPIILDEGSDVPAELIRERLGRVFERKQMFARVG
jgi:hypothetical protein